MGYNKPQGDQKDKADKSTDQALSTVKFIFIYHDEGPRGSRLFFIREKKLKWLEIIRDVNIDIESRNTENEIRNKSKSYRIK